MRSLSLSIALFICTVALGQPKKYLKKNEHPNTLKYADSEIYSRGILVDSSKLILGNSDGSVYFISLKHKAKKRIFKQDNFVECRDVEKSGSHYLGMQSGTCGKLIEFTLNKVIRTIEHPEWKDVFFDGLDVKGKTAFLMGDPTNGRFNLFHSKDGGQNWKRCKGDIKNKKGEAGFAASGSNVQILNDSTYIFISGGEISRFFKTEDSGKTWLKVVLPFYPGESSGAYSIHMATDKIGVIVGGDYKASYLNMNTCFYTFDGGESWFNSRKRPRGYRSCVTYKNGVFYCCGPNGIDFSTNGGINWTPFSNGTFFAIAPFKDKLIGTSKNGVIHIFDLIQ